MEIEACSSIECEDDSRRVTGPFTQRPLPDFEETELADYEADDEAPAPAAAAPAPAPAAPTAPAAAAATRSGRVVRAPEPSRYEAGARMSITRMMERDEMRDMLAEMADIAALMTPDELASASYMPLTAADGYAAVRSQYRSLIALVADSDSDLTEEEGSDSEEEAEWQDSEDDEEAA